MAYSKTEVKEHPSRTIIKTIQAGASTGIYPKLLLLCGKEDFLTQWSVGYLKESLLCSATASLDCNEFSEDAINCADIISACETVPMLSKRKLVFVKDSDILTAQSPRDMAGDEIEYLTSYLANIPETTMLVFTCIKPLANKALYKAIAKYGIIYDFKPLDDATLTGWIAKRFTAAEKTAARSDMLNFAKMNGYGDEEKNYTLFNLENDLKKIFALYDKTEISLSEMLLVSDGAAEVNAFKLLDAAFGGRKGEAIEILHANIDSQLPSKEMGVVLSFLGLIISQLEIMVEGKERLEEGQNTYEIVSAMKVNEYRFKKAMQSCGGKSAKELRAALCDAFQIEKDLKGGNADARYALELFIAGA